MNFRTTFWCPCWIPTSIFPSGVTELKTVIHTESPNSCDHEPVLHVIHIESRMTSPQSELNELLYIERPELEFRSVSQKDGPREKAVVTDFWDF